MGAAVYFTNEDTPWVAQTTRQVPGLESDSLPLTDVRPGKQQSMV